MSYFFILPSYLTWHYSEAFKDITRVWTNFLWFIFNFFSITILLKTFFSPWRRIQEGRTKEGFHPEDIAEAFVTTTVMRIIGMMLRSFIIIVGLLVTLAVFWGGLLFYAVWMLLPVLVPVSFIYGLSLLV